MLRDRLAADAVWEGRRIPTVRWARVFGAHALGIRREGGLLAVMLHEAIEPKRRNPRREARWAT